jgi:hypothetical protein
VENIIIYAPHAIFIVLFIIQLGIFARQSELKAMEAKLMTYAMEHFVTLVNYNQNHTALQNNFERLQKDISDMKNLLINMSGKR